MVKFLMNSSCIWKKQVSVSRNISGEMTVNKTTNTQLYAMKKDELVKFTSNLINHYNASLEESRYKDKVIDSRVFQLKELLYEVCNMQDTLRLLHEEIKDTLESAK